MRGRLLYARYFIPLSAVAITLLLAYLLWDIFDGDIPAEFLLFLLLWPFMELIAFMVVQYGVGRLAVPLRIYADEVVTFPSLAYRLRGVGHRIPREMVTEVVVACDAADPRRASQGRYGVPVEQMATSLRVKLSNGRSRLLATRNLGTARAAARSLGEAWAVPVDDRTLGL